MLQQSNHFGIHHTARPEPPSTPPLSGELFAGLDDAALAEMRYAAQVRHVGPKKNVTIMEERAGNMYLLQKGRARAFILTESGVEVLLLWVVPGDVIGLVSLLANPPAYMANTATVTECEFLVWDHATIRRLAHAYPRLIENGFRMALHHLEAYMKRHTSILTKSAESRLAQALRKLATKAGEVQPSGVVIDITNEQLSSLSDVSYFTASRLLSKWAQHGMLAKQRGRVTLLAPEALMIT